MELVNVLETRLWELYFKEKYIEERNDYFNKCNFILSASSFSSPFLLLFFSFSSPFLLLFLSFHCFGDVAPLVSAHFVDLETNLFIFSRILTGRCLRLMPFNLGVCYSIIWRSDESTFWCGTIILMCYECWYKFNYKIGICLTLMDFFRSCSQLGSFLTGVTLALSTNFPC